MAINGIKAYKLSRLFHYWASKCDGDRLPRRGDIDPVDFYYILGSVSLVDIHRDPLRLYFRIFGTRHVDRHGYDLTGKWLDEAPVSEMGGLLCDWCREVMESAAP